MGKTFYVVHRTIAIFLRRLILTKFDSSYHPFVSLNLLSNISIESYVFPLHPYFISRNLHQGR